ncbi:hypothetical protein [Chelativorans sp. Marseille-P2723]|uniref:hypothetical protein n=1 Tax=Chelativorans sp. Marseille-P2723 TaxID=2709133 RepID=UPI00156D7F1E|nr:hypothetical protein [Chelativorans sp. Marseille-P2723]
MPNCASCWYAASFGCVSVNALILLKIVEKVAFTSRQIDAVMQLQLTGEFHDDA